MAETPSSLLPSDQGQLRRTNLALVLQTLRAGGPRSRARIAADLGLTRGTVSSLVAELAERRLVREAGVERGGVGRPGLTVELDGRTVCGMGAEINVHHIATLAQDLAGRTVAEHRLPLDARALGAEVVLDLLTGLVARTVDDVAAREGRTVALTVGVAGLVDAHHDALVHSPNLDWRDLPLAALLRQRLGGPSFPVTVENEANLAAIAERHPGACDRVDSDRGDLLVVFGEAGVGGGIVADGRLLRGSRGYAGELGHMIVDPRGRRCGCGRTGCWETVVGIRALLDAAADADDPVRDPSLGLEGRLAEINRRAGLGDRRTLSALEQVGDWLGLGAGMLANALNPGVIVLSGYFAEVGHWMREPFTRRLHEAVLAPAAGGSRLELSRHGFRAVVRGGAAVALDTVVNDPTRVERRDTSLIGATR